VEVQRDLGEVVGRDIQFYSVSLDPEFDSAERLRDYRQQYGVGPGWTFLTGDEAEITKLRHRLGAFDPDPVIDADRTEHAGVLVFGNEPRGRWCVIPGLMRPRSIARLIRRAMRL